MNSFNNFNNFSELFGKKGTDEYKFDFNPKTSILTVTKINTTMAKYVFDPFKGFISYLPSEEDASEQDEKLITQQKMEFDGYEPECD